MSKHNSWLGGLFCSFWIWQRNVQRISSRYSLCRYSWRYSFRSSMCLKYVRELQSVWVSPFGSFIKMDSTWKHKNERNAIVVYILGRSFFPHSFNARFRNGGEQVRRHARSISHQKRQTDTKFSCSNSNEKCRRFHLAARRSPLLVD